MKTLKVFNFSFVIFSAVCIFSVSLMALINPQSVMDLVNVQLPNNDAYSSIRGIYGGVGFVLSGFLVYLLFKDTFTALVFLMMIWGAYALSRLTTILVEGPLGDFGNQWLMIESLLTGIALVLVLFTKKSMKIHAY